jgi:DNA-binding transcriptional LysR family regulator
LLASETFIDENSGFMDYVADFISKPMHAPQETIGVRDFLTALCLVASGSGVALVPESLRSVVMRNVTYCTTTTGRWAWPSPTERIGWSRRCMNSFSLPTTSDTMGEMRMGAAFH